MPINLDFKKMKHGTTLLKRGFAKMQKGGVIMDVTDAKQAKIAEKAGAVAVMALERVPADIRAEGGVARMANPNKITEIIKAVTIPVMAKCRIGHFVEAQVLEVLGVDMIDESEVLTPADPFFHVDKSKFNVPFVCGCRNLGEACRRIGEGAAMIRTKGEAGTGNIVEAMRHAREVLGAIGQLKTLDQLALNEFARKLEAPIGVLSEVKALGRLPVVNFAAGGIATPADAALMMQMGMDGVFVGSGIFKSADPAVRAKAIVEAVLNYDDPKVIAKVSRTLGEAMKGIEISTIPKEQLLQGRGW
jgi:pyridoxal 5'-phosphate synthase pdxS subunit